MAAAVGVVYVPAASVQLVSSDNKGRSLGSTYTKGLAYRNKFTLRQLPRQSVRSIARGACFVRAAAAESIKAEGEVEGMTSFLDSLKYSDVGLVTVMAQDVDSGAVLMQAFADRAAVCETMQTGLATFYSRSRKERWCKGETSGNFIKVQNIYVDCDRDSIIYLSVPIGPSCHTGSHTCWFTEAGIAGEDSVTCLGEHTSEAWAPKTTLFQLEATIQQRKEDLDVEGLKPSWTGKLLSKPELLCSKIREEAGELCETLEKDEGKERAASEMADLLYHSMVLLNLQGVSMQDVMEELRGRFGTSGIDEKAARKAK